jgi:hypothetical protein
MAEERALERKGKDDQEKAGTRRRLDVAADTV